MKARLAGTLLLLLCVMAMPVTVSAQDAKSGDVDIMSGGKAYKSYIAVPEGTGSAGTHPGIILIHSFNGLEEGYRTMSDELAKRGFVVLALGWQTFDKNVDDATVQTLIEDGVKYLSERDDIESGHLGLTGFCAGGRFTMLFLPQIKSFKAGVAWYGFPERGDPSPTALIDKLEASMLIIHGTEDAASPIDNIFKYATALRAAKKSFELKVYSGEPHGFMLQGGQLRKDDVGQDAFDQMATYFTRHLMDKTAS
jgi:carboxymethylenebutenolidase